MWDDGGEDKHNRERTRSRTNIGTPPCERDLSASSIILRRKDILTPSSRGGRLVDQIEALLINGAALILLLNMKPPPADTAKCAILAQRSVSPGFCITARVTLSTIQYVEGPGPSLSCFGLAMQYAEHRHTVRAGTAMTSG